MCNKTMMMMMTMMIMMMVMMMMMSLETSNFHETLKGRSASEYL